MSPIWFLSAAIFFLVIFGLGYLPILGRAFHQTFDEERRLR
jgi:hypothetical protein